MTSVRPTPRAPTPSPDGDSGLFVGRYELLSRIGSGGMGEVYLARAVGAGGFAKEVVIKRILPHLARDEGFVQRFIEEGKLVVRLRHAGIAQVLDMGEDGGVFFIAMEHVDGKDLGELMRIAGAAQMKMPVPLVAHLLASLLDALDYAHRAKDTEGRPLGIIHRDVSPSNVMIATTGEVKLLDFGIARATERLQASTTGAIRGKYSYMSPQQAAGAELDARSDLFSVGVIAWELLTGERPFDGSSDLLTLDRIRYHDPGALAAKAPEVPADLAAIVERLLAKVPEGRFASADEAAEALRAHMVRSGKLATARELAAWQESVRESLPRGLRERSVQGLSIDDLLRMSLGSEPGGAAAAQTPSGVSLGTPRGQTMVVSSGLVIANEVLPLGAGAGAVPTTATGAGSRKSFPMLLVGLNLSLIVLVLFLVLRTDGDDRPAGADAGATREAADVVQLATVDVTATRADVAGKPEDGGVEVVAAVVVQVAPPPVAAGLAAGAVLAGLDESIFAGEVSLTVRVHPPGATVAATGFGSGRAPRTFVVRRGSVLSLRVTAPDHEPRTYEAVADESDAISITLKPVARGRVQFKFFPAEGTRVSIDGKGLALAGNVVGTELPVGSHTLLLETDDGRRLRRPFEVAAGETTNLGTLEVGSPN